MFELFICIAASLGAGVTAGLAGISTATVISPLLIALLGFDAYEALGIILRAGGSNLRASKAHSV